MSAPSRLRILMVDDDESACDTVKMLLEFVGLRAETLCTRTERRLFAFCRGQIQLCFAYHAMGEELPRQAEGRPKALSPERHSGVVTLLFTDVVGTTALKQRLGDCVGVALIQLHYRLIPDSLKQFCSFRECCLRRRGS